MKFKSFNLIWIHVFYCVKHKHVACVHPLHLTWDRNKSVLDHVKKKNTHKNKTKQKTEKSSADAIVSCHHCLLVD